MIRLQTLLVLLMLAGCTYSVHPLLTEKELADDIDTKCQW
jgi:hypothetical protein